MMYLQKLWRCIALFLVTVLSATGLLVTVGTNAGALGLPSFSFSPIALPGSTPRGAFHYDMLPGQTINDSVVLKNPTNQLEQFQIWASDAYNTPQGGALTLRPLGYHMTEVGTWIATHLGTGIYGLNPRTSVTVNFSVTAPANATPGTHVGGIEALNVTPVPQPNGGHAHFVIHNGIGAAMFIQIAGPTHAAAAVSDISVDSSVPAIGFGHRSAVVSYELENTGNTLLSGTAVATVTDLFGRTVKTFRPVGVQVFVPGGRFKVTEPTWNNLPFIGPETVHVRFTSTGMKPATGDSTFWIFPWLLILVILLILGLLIWRIIVRRRNRANATPPSGGGDGGPEGDGGTTPDSPIGAESPAEPSVANLS